jgi:hypothetical protein
VKPKSKSKSAGGVAAGVNNMVDQKATIRKLEKDKHEAELKVLEMEKNGCRTSRYERTATSKKE